MKNGARYEVTTHWGHFSLDEGAYQDYLAGKLWISWKPGESDHRRFETDNEVMPTDITDDAIALRESVSKIGILPVLQQRFPHCQVDIPYKSHMEDLSIEELNLTVRASNGLMRAGASTFGKLVDLMTRETGLKSVRNLGTKSEKEITKAFFTACYEHLTLYEKAAFFQSILNLK